MTATLRKPVVLVGMMGSGKTAVGRALAEMLAVPFLDSDHEIERAASATISEIFARDGEPFFRDREAEVILRLLQGPPAVLSTGGGAWMQPRNREAIGRHGASVWLDADLPLLWSRVQHKDTRPLLRTADPRATLEQIYHDRVPAYQLADLRVAACASYEVRDMALAVREALETAGILGDAAQ